MRAVRCGTPGLRDSLMAHLDRHGIPSRPYFTPIHLQPFYRDRFGNAADFTFFIVGAFSVDEVTPYLERWVASLPSTGKKTSAFKDMGIRFPTTEVKEEVKKGREPRGQTLMSFFADTKLDELEMHRARAAALGGNVP